VAAVAVAAFGQPSAIIVDYPAAESVFPPEFPAPLFQWRDPAGGTRWQIEIRFGDGSPAIRAQSRGEPIRVGEVDPTCIGATAPALAAEQAAAHAGAGAGIGAQAVHGVVVRVGTQAIGIHIAGPGQSSAGISDARCHQDQGLDAAGVRRQVERVAPADRCPRGVVDLDAFDRALDCYFGFLRLGDFDIQTQSLEVARVQGNKWKSPTATLRQVDEPVAAEEITNAQNGAVLSAEVTLHEPKLRVRPKGVKPD